jgi:hypothetical protein
MGRWTASGNSVEVGITQAGPGIIIESHFRPADGSSRKKPMGKHVKSSGINDNLSFTGLSLDVGEMTYRGKSLKQIREQLGIDLKVIASETRINLRILERIEEEDLEHLPAMVYLKGFLKSYAQALHLDPRKVIDGYLKLFQEEKKR